MTAPLLRLAPRATPGRRLRALALVLGLSSVSSLSRAQSPPAQSPPSATPAAPATPAPSATDAPTAAPSAAPLPPRSQEERDRANALMDEGDAAIEKGDLPAALTAYQGAHSIMGVPTTGIEVARTLDRTGRLREALAAAREVAAFPVTTGEPKPFAEAREQARSLVTTLEARIPTLTITVKIPTSGARPDVTLDGKKLTTADLQSPLSLEPGRYRVAASADDHTPASVEVTLKERDRAQVALALARVLIVPPPPTEKPPPPPPPPSLSPLIPIGFSVAGVGAVVGAITGALAISSANSANNLCPAGLCRSPSSRDEAQRSYNTADALAVGADISFVVALAGAAMGIYGIAVSVQSPEPPHANKPRASFLFGPGNAALRVSF